MIDQQRQGVVEVIDSRDNLVEDLTTMVKRLAWMLNQKSPHHPLVGSAVALLKKNGLGNIASPK
jgi:hypothetical protein